MSQRVYAPPINPGQIPPPSPDIYGIMGEANIFRMMEDFLVNTEDAQSPREPDRGFGVL